MIDFLHNNFGYLLSGISVGGQYALIAIGYTMVYGILRLINFAHGDVFMVAGLIMVYAIAGGLPMWLSIILVLVLTVVLGVVIERVAYKPLRSSPRMSVMISAIGVSYLLQNCALYFTGGLPRSYPVIPFLTKSVKIWGATTKMVTVVTPILTILLVIVLVLLIKYTKIGMAMRAVSKDFETSQLMGIKINSVISFTFVIGCFLAAALLVEPCLREVRRAVCGFPGFIHADKISLAVCSAGDLRRRLGQLLVLPAGIDEIHGYRSSQQHGEPRSYELLLP